MSPHHRGEVGGHSADPVGVGVASFLHSISLLDRFNQTYTSISLGGEKNAV